MNSPARILLISTSSSRFWSRPCRGYGRTELIGLAETVMGGVEVENRSRRCLRLAPPGRLVALAQRGAGPPIDLEPHAAGRAGQDAPPRRQLVQQDHVPARA